MRFRDYALRRRLRTQPDPTATADSIVGLFSVLVLLWFFVPGILERMFG